MKKLITEEEIIKLSSEGKREIRISKNTILTPSAIDRIRSLKIKIVDEETIENEYGSSTAAQEVKTIVIGSDHTGFEVKKTISEYLTKQNYKIIDVGTSNENSCDYPDFALAVAQKRLSAEADRGIMIDATGIPSAITINKLPGIRAATCYNEFSARSAREHNNACVLCVGAKSLGEETIKSVVDVFLKTEFLGGRHQRRLDKITAVENKLLNRNNS